MHILGIYRYIYKFMESTEEMGNNGYGTELVIMGWVTRVRRLGGWFKTLNSKQVHWYLRGAHTAPSIYLLTYYI